VSSAWAYAVAAGEDIVMKSDGSQIRSYCYCLDCASAILKVLVKGESVRAYNISNPDSVISIKQMAELLAESADVELRFELPTEAEKKGFNPMSNSSLDSTELQELGWKGLFGAERGFAHTVEILKELQQYR
jgi:nucleoside-diphosphate-sugar epimerase